MTAASIILTATSLPPSIRCFLNRSKPYLGDGGGDDYGDGLEFEVVQMEYNVVEEIIYGLESGILFGARFSQAVGSYVHHDQCVLQWYRLLPPGKSYRTSIFLDNILMKQNNPDLDDEALDIMVENAIANENSASLHSSTSTNIPHIEKI